LGVMARRHVTRRCSQPLADVSLRERTGVHM
jgi:hypothetical protein